MDDGEVDFSNHEMLSNSFGDLPSVGGSMDSFFEELMKDTHACTHTHTCNPPGPDFSHTHTCFHVHTKIVSASTEDKADNDNDNDNDDDAAESVGKKAKKRSSSGNREAVRKYREKKKARTASLEDEVVRLRALNQQLLKRLQGQAAVEAEAARLRCLLVDIRGRIEGEIGSFPYQKTVNNLGLPGSYVRNPCNVQCGEEIYCLGSGADGRNYQTSLSQGFTGCDFENVNCFANLGTGPKQFAGCGPCDAGNLTPRANSSGDGKRKGANYEATSGQGQ